MAYRNKEQMEKFHHILNTSDQSIEEFESKWDNWTEINHRQDNKWLESMFLLRYKWGPFYITN